MFAASGHLGQKFRWSETSVRHHLGLRELSVTHHVKVMKAYNIP